MVDEFTAAHRAARDTAAEAMRAAGPPPDQNPDKRLLTVSDPASAAKPRRGNRLHRRLPVTAEKADTTAVR